jgi:prepilin-type processing-associated H-X9-DG protein
MSDSRLPIEYATPAPKRKSLLPLALFVTALVSVPILIVMFGFSRPNVYMISPRVACANNLRQIALASIMYANADPFNRFPDTLNDVLETQEIASDVFVCPDTNATPARGPTTRATANNLTAGGHLSYIYVGKGLTTAADSKTVLVYEPLTNHGSGANVGYADAHVEWQPAKELNKILSELSAGHNPPRPEKLK